MEKQPRKVPHRRYGDLGLDGFGLSPSCIGVDARRDGCADHGAARTSYGFDPSTTLFQQRTFFYRFEQKIADQ